MLCSLPLRPDRGDTQTLSSVYNVLALQDLYSGNSTWKNDVLNNMRTWTGSIDIYTNGTTGAQRTNSNAMCVIWTPFHIGSRHNSELYPGNGPSHSTTHTRHTEIPVFSIKRKPRLMRSTKTISRRTLRLVRAAVDVLRNSATVVEVLKAACSG